MKDNDFLKTILLSFKSIDEKVISKFLFETFKNDFMEVDDVSKQTTDNLNDIKPNKICYVITENKYVIVFKYNSNTFYAVVDFNEETKRFSIDKKSNELLFKSKDDLFKIYNSLNTSENIILPVWSNA